MPLVSATTAKGPTSSALVPGKASALRQAPLPAPQRIPVHLRGVPPAPPAPPSPHLAVIEAAEHRIACLSTDIIAATQRAYSLHDSVLHCLQRHRETLACDRIMLEEKQQENRRRIDKARQRVSAVAQRLELEELQVCEWQERRRCLQDELDGISSEVSDVRDRQRRRIEVTHSLREAARASQADIAAVVEHISASRQKKADLMNNLDTVKQQVSQDQAEERSALAELHQRQKVIREMQHKIQHLQKHSSAAMHPPKVRVAAAAPKPR